MVAKLKFDSVKVGDEIPKIEIKGVTRPDFVRYAGASGDFVPLHYDQTFVEAADLLAGGEVPQAHHADRVSRGQGPAVGREHGRKDVRAIAVLLLAE